MKIIFIILSLLFFISCKQDEPEYLYALDVQHQVCEKRVITNYNPLKTMFVEDQPIANCDGMMGPIPKDYLHYKRKIEKFLTELDQLKENCKQFVDGVLNGS